MSSTYAEIKILRKKTEKLGVTYNKKYCFTKPYNHTYTGLVVHKSAHTRACTCGFLPQLQYLINTAVWYNNSVFCTLNPCTIFCKLFCTLCTVHSLTVNLTYHWICYLLGCRYVCQSDNLTPYRIYRKYPVTWLISPLRYELLFSWKTANM